MTEIHVRERIQTRLDKAEFVPLHCVNNFIDIWSSLTETNQDKSKYLQHTFIYHFLSLLITILQILYYIRLFHAYEHAQPVNSVHTGIMDQSWNSSENHSICCKIEVLWEGHKIMRNHHLTFDCMYQNLP